MRSSVERLIVALMTIVMITTACGKGEIDTEAANTPSTDVKTEDQTETNPPAESTSEDSDIQAKAILRTFDSNTIELTLDDTSIATVTIGPEGGSFSTIDVDGVEYTLIVPEGALLYNEAITMTPIANLEGEVINEIFQAGVKLEPEGLHFLELVSIEISSIDIEEGAVGFTTQAGGENFHLIPSTSSDGSLLITTTHFTEFGVSQEMIEDINELSKIAGDAWLEYQLATGGTKEQLVALERVVDQLIDRGESGINLNNWEPWTTETISLLLRTGQVTTKNNWDENTPGFKNLMTKIQSLVDLWFQETDGVVQEIREKCIQGEIDYIARLQKIINVGNWLTSELKLENRAEHFLGYREVYDVCFGIGVTWQANVVTTGSGFLSDISLGAEAEFDGEETLQKRENLEVEYIEGFWHETCEPKNGNIDISVKVHYNDKNLGIVSGTIIDGITVRVRIIEQVFIDCGQGLVFNADAQAPFHGGALDRINSNRISDLGGWEFKLDFNPGGGVIGQYEEGPLELTWDQGQYNLWQMITVYQPTSAD